MPKPITRYKLDLNNLQGVLNTKIQESKNHGFHIYKKKERSEKFHVNQFIKDWGRCFYVVGEKEKEKLKGNFSFKNKKDVLQHFKIIETKNNKLQELLNKNERRLIISSEDVNKMLKLIEEGANVNSVSKKGYSALHLAAKTNDEYFVGELLKITGINVTLEVLNTSIQAIDLTEDKDIERMLQKGPIQLALALAVDSNEMDLVKILIKNGADVNKVLYDIRFEDPELGKMSQEMRALLKSHQKTETLIVDADATKKETLLRSELKSPTDTPKEKEEVKEKDPEEIKKEKILTHVLENLSGSEESKIKETLFTYNQSNLSGIISIPFSFIALKTNLKISMGGKGNTTFFLYLDNKNLVGKCIYQDMKLVIIKKHGETEQYTVPGNISFILKKNSNPSSERILELDLEHGIQFSNSLLFKSYTEGMVPSLGSIKLAELEEDIRDKIDGELSDGTLQPWKHTNASNQIKKLMFAALEAQEVIDKCIAIDPENPKYQQISKNIHKKVSEVFNKRTGLTNLANALNKIKNKYNIIKYEKHLIHNLDHNIEVLNNNFIFSDENENLVLLIENYKKLHLSKKISTGELELLENILIKYYSVLTKSSDKRTSDLLVENFFETANNIRPSQFDKFKLFLFGILRFFTSKFDNIKQELQIEILEKEKLANGIIISFLKRESVLKKEPSLIESLEKLEQDEYVTENNELTEIISSGLSVSHTLPTSSSLTGPGSSSLYHQGPKKPSSSIESEGEIPSETPGFPPPRE